MLNPLLVSLDSKDHIHLIIGSGALASARCASSIAAGARPIIIAPANAVLHFKLLALVDAGDIDWVKEDFRDVHLRTLGREAVDGTVDAVFVTDPTVSERNSNISLACQRLRIPVNVADASKLCSFSMLSTHSDGPVHIGITTSGNGCKLASKIRRELSSALPPGLGAAVEKLGHLRRQLQVEDETTGVSRDDICAADEDDTATQRFSLNRLVSEDDEAFAKSRRLRWLAQICEYWSLSRLASITDDDVENLFAAFCRNDHKGLDARAVGALEREKRTERPRIMLAGAGPGSPDMLTIATRRAIETATFILADKLVPEGVLALIPRRTVIHIARKFPGNAEAAQEELLNLGLQALQRGHTVLRLKQGDPYLYGRGAEEVAFFRHHGLEPVVLPGITSALSAPLFAGIPITHRAVADQVLICTGTGRKGVSPVPPNYNPSQTVVFLMALHRLQSLVESLVHRPRGVTIAECEEDDSIHNSGDPSSTAWPVNMSCAVIERASCPDQRVIRSSLEHICRAVEEAGGRPPGLLIVGRCCDVLQEGNESSAWTIEEGCPDFGTSPVDPSILKFRDQVLESDVSCTKDVALVDGKV